MKKTVFLATTAVLGGLLASTVAFADTPANQSTYSDATTGKSTANVTLTKPDKNPVQPNVPGKPDNPSDGNPGNTNTADLMLKYVSHFDFGSKELSAQSSKAPVKTIGLVDANGKATNEKTVPYAKVSDTRGTAEGWQLKVKQDAEFQNAAKTNKINGAQINIATVTPVDGTGVTTTDVQGKSQTIDQTTGDAIIMSTTGAHHFGEYSAMFGNPTETGDTTDGVQLLIPGNSALADDYSTTLTWTLESVPAKN